AAGTISPRYWALSAGAGGRVAARGAVAAAAESTFFGAGRCGSGGAGPAGGAPGPLPGRGGGGAGGAARTGRAPWPLTVGRAGPVVARSQGARRQRLGWERSSRSV